MAGILACPPEVMVQILQQFDSFTEIMRLACTCKHLYSLWEAHAPLIGCKLAQECVIEFDRALMAVRLTKALGRA